MDAEFDRTGYGLETGPHPAEMSPVPEAVGGAATVSTTVVVKVQTQSSHHCRML